MYAAPNHLVGRMASGKKFKDTKCPRKGRTYTAAQITSAITTENSKTNPNIYRNLEQYSYITEQLYKAYLDVKPQTGNVTLRV
jgi:hypothetical protein